MNSSYWLWLEGAWRPRRDRLNLTCSRPGGVTQVGSRGIRDVGAVLAARTLVKQSHRRSQPAKSHSHSVNKSSHTHIKETNVLCKVNVGAKESAEDSVHLHSDDGLFIYFILREPAT